MFKSGNAVKNLSTTIEKLIEPAVNSVEELVSGTYYAEMRRLQESLRNLKVTINPENLDEIEKTRRKIEKLDKQLKALK